MAKCKKQAKKGAPVGKGKKNAQMKAKGKNKAKKASKATKGPNKACPTCSGKGVIKRQKRVPGQKSAPKKKRDVPAGNAFPWFFKYCSRKANTAQTNLSKREKFKQQGQIMIKAAVCWKKLTREQKDYFKNNMMPIVKTGGTPPPPPGLSNSGNSSADTQPSRSSGTAADPQPSSSSGTAADPQPSSSSGTAADPQPGDSSSPPPSIRWSPGKSFP